MKTILLSIISSYFVIFLSGVNCYSSQKMTVFVSISPQKYFVQQISKGVVDVEVMVKPGASPATYEPKPSQMAKLSSSSAYFAIGVPFENRWLERIGGVNEEMRIVHTDEGIEKISMAAHYHADIHGKEKDHHPDYQDGEEEEHHGGMDPHIWLAPSLVKKQVTIIAAALGEMLPEHAADFQENSRAFIAEIDELDGQLREILEADKISEFMVFHPSWGYFAKEYGLKQVPIELEGKSPKLSQLKELIHHAKDTGITTVFVQPQFSGKSAKVIAREIGGKVVVADPLAEDWLANLKQVATNIKTNQ